MSHSHGVEQGGLACLYGEALQVMNVEGKWLRSWHLVLAVGIVTFAL